MGAFGNKTVSQTKIESGYPTDFVHYWAVDDAVDSSGWKLPDTAGNHPTIDSISTEPYSSTPDGIEFDNTQSFFKDYIRSNNIANLDIDLSDNSTGDWTLALSFTDYDGAYSYPGYVFSCSNGANQQPINIRIDVPNLYISDNASTDSETTWNASLSANKKYTLFLINYDTATTQKAKICIKEENVGTLQTQTLNAVCTEMAGPGDYTYLYVASRSFNTGSGFNGVCHWFGFFDRALTDNEMTGLADSGRPEI